MKLLLLVLLLFNIAIEPVRANESDRKIKFNIPGTTVSEALIKLAQQSGMPLLVSFELVKSERANSLQGEFTLDEGLHQLLDGSGLVAKVNDRGVIVVRTGPMFNETSEEETAMVENSRNSVRNTKIKHRKSSFLTSASALVMSIFGITSPAHSEDAAAAAATAADAAQVEEIVVRGYRFLDADTSGTTNLPMSIEKVPQSISLVNQDFIENAQLTNLGELADHVPGLVNGANQGGENFRARSRGFDFNFRYSTKLDGLNLTVNGERDYAVYERVEFVKGPQSVTYGVTTPAGVVNYVTKRAPTEASGYVSGHVGSFNYRRYEAQYGGPVNESGSVRALGLVAITDTNGPIDYTFTKGYTVYGALDFDLNEKLSGFVHVIHEDRHGLADDGIPSYPDGSHPRLPRNFFIGNDQNNRFATEVTVVSAALNYNPTEYWEVGVKGNYTASNGFRRVGFAYDLNYDNSVTYGAAGLSNDYENNTGNIALTTVYKLDQLGLKDSFISAMLLHVRGSNPSQPNFGTIPDGQFSLDWDQETVLAFTRQFNYVRPNFHFLSNFSSTIASVQSVISPIENLSLLGGLSWVKSDQRFRRISNSTGNTLADTEDKFPTTRSLRLGATYELPGNVNVYASYSESFLPQTAVDVNSNYLPPVGGTQYEAGVKARILDEKLLLTAAAFNIKEKNTAAFDAQVDGSDRFKALGEVTHKGFELEALGNVTKDFQISAGYAYLDAKTTKTDDLLLLGKRRSFRPKHTANVFATYDFYHTPQGKWSIGGGGSYVGSVITTDDDSTLRLPSYTLVDAVVSYQTDVWEFRINAKNLLNKYYLINKWDTLFYGDYIGQPRTIIASVRRNF